MLRKIRKCSPPEGRSLESPIPLPSLLCLWIVGNLLPNAFLTTEIPRRPRNPTGPGSQSRTKGRLSQHLRSAEAFSHTQEPPVLTESTASNKPLQLQHQGTDKHTEEAARQLHACLNTSVPSGPACLQETSCVHLTWKNKVYHVYKTTREKKSFLLQVKPVLPNPCYSHSLKKGLVEGFFSFSFS